MKKLLCAVLASAMLSGCAAAPAGTSAPAQTTGPVPATAPKAEDTVLIRLSDEGVQFPANSGIHTAEEAAAHAVVHITKPGTYALTGTLSAGQIAVDLGENAKDDPNAVVTLILDGVDITCPSAPAVVFYNVYESGEPGGPAGARVILAEGSSNHVNGSHTEDYDGAFYSRMSMDISGEGSLHIDADNEGLCSERHLTINSGKLTIESGNDGINANADGVSVITVSGGELCVTVTGETGEGDGIDSNGSIVIKGGIVDAFACGSSMDSGLDADMGILISGGMVLATGNMPDRIEDGSQTYAVFDFSQPQSRGSYALKRQDGTALFEITPPNTFTCLLYSAPALLETTYTLWSGDTQFEGVTGGGFRPMDPIDRPEFPDRGGDGDVQIPPQPTNPIVTQGTVQPSPEEQPENMPVPPLPEGGGNMPVPPSTGEDSAQMPMPQLPGGVMPPRDGSGMPPVQVVTGTRSTDFPITKGANYFSMVRAAE